MPETTTQPAADSTSTPQVNHDQSGDSSEAQAAEETRDRLRRLPPEVGAVLLSVGVAGLILPGPFGTPFLLAGGVDPGPAIFLPGRAVGTEAVSRHASRRPLPR